MLSLVLVLIIFELIPPPPRHEHAMMTLSEGEGMEKGRRGRSGGRGIQGEERRMKEGRGNEKK